MPAILSAIPWKLLGYAALAIGAWLAWQHYQGVVAERDENLAAAVRLAGVAKQNADTVAQQSAQHAKALAAVNTVHELATVRQAKIVTIKEKIAHAPPAACPMPAALADALGWLREQSAAGAGTAPGESGGAGRAAEAAGADASPGDQPR